jgi:3-oxoacyl-[acyl-carrier protein] reductase
MHDILLELSQNPQARKVIQGLGLPIPMPQSLKRGEGALQEQPLFDQEVLVHSSGEAHLLPAIADTLASCGARPLVVGGDVSLKAFKAAGEAWGRPPVALTLDDLPTEHKPSVLLWDATTQHSVDELQSLYRFFHNSVRSLRRNGRVVVLGRPPEKQTKAGVAATQAALEGFVRSLAKELGRKGSTVQLVYVEKGAEARLPVVLRFLLSSRSAYVTGQPIRVNTTVKAPETATPWTFSLDGKVALVTGAARGIGAATAERLAEEGAHVVCLDRPDDAEPTSQLARRIGGSVLLLDVTDKDAAQTIARTLQDEHGGVDIVVHNAGVTRDRTLAKMSPDLWDLAMNVNLQAVLKITETLLEGTLNDNGRIVCLSSIAGIAGNVGQTNYAASKSGVIGLVRSLAPMVAERGVTINAIAPGFIETRLTAAIPAMIREVGRRMNNLSQGGQPVDVAEAILFFSLPQNHGVSGQVLRVCGGSLIGA